MYSVKDDTVLDPFLGTGTTIHACMAAERNSIGIEVDKSFSDTFFSNLDKIEDIAKKRVEKRLTDHKLFILDYIERKGQSKHKNDFHGVAVITKQETKIELNRIDKIEMIDNSVKVEYVVAEDESGKTKQLKLF